LKTFDRRLGKALFDALPGSPGIYRFYDEAGQLIYVGKAKNLRRRLSQYRNAKRRKAHAKMRKIVAEAVRLEHESCVDEFEALALENRWIQEHRPKWNVAGAFFFLYPLVGMRLERDRLFLCYTTTPEAHPSFEFHGAFRSRERTREAFFALAELLRLIGHVVPKNQLAKLGLRPEPKSRTYIYGFRQVPDEWCSRLSAFLRGEDFGAIEDLSLRLLERPTAVARSAEMQEHLYAIRRFWRHEITALRRAREHSASNEYPIPQRERDRLFIALRAR
jgi:excinuclease ABC subunit C